MKRIFIYCLILLSLCLVPLCVKSEESVVIPRGTTVRVYPNEVLSSMTNQEGDRVTFINQADMWLEETNIIPLNTQFQGYVDTVKMPVKGVNGAIKFTIDNMVYPDGREVRINAIIQMNGQALIGGGMAPPTSYNYTIHTQKPMGWFGGLKGVLQYVPSGEYDFGKHTTIGPKDLLFIVFQEDVEI